VHHFIPDSFLEGREQTQWQAGSVKSREPSSAKRKACFMSILKQSLRGTKKVTIVTLKLQLYQLGTIVA